jgi:hypothetical protein
MFGEGLLDAIQLNAEHLPDCQQPRHSPRVLIRPQGGTTFPLLLASSMKVFGINGHGKISVSSFKLRRKALQPILIAR